MDYIEVFRDGGGSWRWHRKAGNGEIVATNGEGLENKDYAVESAREYNEGVSDIRVIES